jgi:two-component system response regulator
MANRLETERPILLVEDSVHDAELLCHALEMDMDSSRIVHVRDGVAALEWLEGTVDRAGRLPQLVLVDLKMPRMTGMELLAHLRRDSRFRQLPVVMMTSSNHAEDLIAAYDHGVNAYVRKPLEFTEFAAIVRQLMHFWVTINLIPPDEAA